MKWIKYQIVQSVIDGQPILIDKKVGYNETSLAIAAAEAYNGEYTFEEDGVTFDKEPLAIEFGGTNAENAEDARSNLGVIPAPIEQEVQEGYLYLNSDGTTKLINLPNANGVSF